MAKIMLIEYPYLFQKDLPTNKSLFFRCSFSFLFSFSTLISRLKLHLNHTINHLLKTLKFCRYFAHWRILFTMLSHNELYYFGHRTVVAHFTSKNLRKETKLEPFFTYFFGIQSNLDNILVIFRTNFENFSENQKAFNFTSPVIF